VVIGYGFDVLLGIPTVLHPDEAAWIQNAFDLDGPSQALVACRLKVAPDVAAENERLERASREAVEGMAASFFPEE
jgi:hypothetical protein